MSEAAADPLGRMIQSRAWMEASAEIQARLARAESGAKRTFYFLFLANLSKRMIVQSRRARDSDAAARHAEDASRWHECAAQESPDDAEARIAFAAFQLKHRRDARAALALLGPFSEEDRAPKDNLDWLEHRRLALRGAALVIAGEREAGLGHLEEAYGERFRAKFRSADKGPLWFIAIGGARLDEAATDRLLDALRGFGMANERNLAKLRPALIEGDPFAYLEG